MVMPLMLGGDNCIRKDLRSPYIVSRRPRLKAGRRLGKSLKNFFHVKENSCQSGAAVHNKPRS